MRDTTTGVNVHESGFSAGPLTTVPPLPDTDIPLPSNHCTHFRHDSSSSLIPPAAIWAPRWKHRALCLTWLLGRWPITADGGRRQMTMTSAALGIIIWPTEGLSSSVLWKNFQLVLTPSVWTRSSVNTSDWINKTFKYWSCIICEAPFASGLEVNIQDLHVCWSKTQSAAPPLLPPCGRSADWLNSTSGLCEEVGQDKGF